MSRRRENMLKIEIKAYNEENEEKASLAEEENKYQRRSPEERKEAERKYASLKWRRLVFCLSNEEETLVCRETLSALSLKKLEMAEGVKRNSSERLKEEKSV